jgi:hypothetical protein
MMSEPGPADKVPPHLGDTSGGPAGPPKRGGRREAVNRRWSWHRDTGLPRIDCPECRIANDKRTTNALPAGLSRTLTTEARRGGSTAEADASACSGHHRLQWPTSGRPRRLTRTFLESEWGTYSAGSTLGKACKKRLGATRHRSQLWDAVKGRGPAEQLSLEARCGEEDRKSLLRATKPVTEVATSIRPCATRHAVEHHDQTAGATGHLTGGAGEESILQGVSWNRKRRR